MRTKLLTLSLAFLFTSVSYCHACSCMLAHPQEHYCNSDFVILARVKKEQIMESTASKVYKVRVRKEFKISEKGLVALKSGRLHTSLYDSMCGVNLEIGKLYVISGRITSLKAHVSLCNMAVEWSEVSRRQKKGLKLLYKHGCACKIRNCLHHTCTNSRQWDTCNWKSKCETLDGICIRQASGSCMWNRNKLLTSCRLGMSPRRNNSIAEPYHHVRPRQRIPTQLIP